MRTARDEISNGTSRNITEQEKQLVKMLAPAPNFTDSATRKHWETLGPFPLEKLLDDNKLSIDTRLKYSIVTTSTRQYEG